MPLRQAPLAVLALLLPALAGCTWFQPPGPPVPDIHPAIQQAAFVVPALDVRVDSPYANVRLAGPAVAVAVAFDGVPAAAVYLGPDVSWRADAIFGTRERAPRAGDVFVEPPLGEWAAHHAAAGWRNATAEDLAAAGFADPQALFKRASLLLPANLSRPAAATWVLNGTVAAKFQPGNTSLATEEGPFVFQRNATGFLVVENRTVLNFDERNRTLAGSNDALIQAASRDPELSTLTFSWTGARVDVRLRTPPFKATDLDVTDDRLSRIVNVKLAGVGEVSMVSYVTADVRDNRAELRSQNMTVLMGP